MTKAILLMVREETHMIAAHLNTSYRHFFLFVNEVSALIFVLECKIGLIAMMHSSTWWISGSWHP